MPISFLTLRFSLIAGFSGLWISISDEMIQFGILHVGIQHHEVTVDLVRIQMIQCRQLVFHTVSGTQVYRQMFGSVLPVGLDTRLYQHLPREDIGRRQIE